MLGDQALSDTFEAIGRHAFPATDEDRTIHWEKRATHNRGKIMIGDKAVDDEKLNEAGSVPVPAGSRVLVYDMTVKLS
jgi:hypothetical protein